MGDFQVLSWKGYLPDLCRCTIGMPCPTSQPPLKVYKGGLCEQSALNVTWCLKRVKGPLWPLYCDPMSKMLSYIFLHMAYYWGSFSSVLFASLICFALLCSALLLYCTFKTPALSLIYSALFVLLWFALLCSAPSNLLWSALDFFTQQWPAVIFSALLFSTMHCSLPCSSLICTALYCFALHCSALLGTSLAFSKLLCSALLCPCLLCFKLLYSSVPCTTL